MVVLIQLVHAEAGRRVVQASAMERERCVAVALGEAATAEDAEDRARRRLADLLNSEPVARPAKPPAEGTASEVRRPAPRVPHTEPETLEESPEPDPGPDPDPEDWSSELANLELQLRRLGWDRDQESLYLQRAFGHGSRSRLTRYGDLLAYLRALESLAAGSDPQSCSVPLRRADLLQQSDQLLHQLGWDASRGRQLLESRFGKSSRQQLMDSQLLEFNMVLEGELLTHGTVLSGALSSNAAAD